jgi:hypothetical protein
MEIIPNGAGRHVKNNQFVPKKKNRAMEHITRLSKWLR